MIMRFKKKYVVIFILSMLFIGLGTLAISAFIPKKPNQEQPIVDQSDPDYQNKIVNKPAEGSALNYSLKDNLFIAIGVLRDKNSYQVQTEGVTTAKVGFVDVSQKLKGQKYVNNGEVFNESISHGMQSVAKQLYVTKNDYLVREADSIKSLDEVNWNDKPVNYSKEGFLTLFGQTYFDFTQYILNDKSVLDAELISKDDNTITVKYLLDNKYAPSAYRREIKTMSGSKDLPEFINASITITMNKDWEILKTVTNESYYVSVFGSIRTSGEVINIFTYNDTNIPNRNFFEAYFGQDTVDVVDKELTSLDYLMAVASPLIANDDNINFDASIVVNDHPMSLKGTINLNKLHLLINLDDYLHLQFDGDNWYFKYDELIGSVSKETIKDLFKIELTEEMLTSLMSPDKIGDIEKNLSHKIVGDSVFITIDFDFGYITLEAETKDYQIRSINGKLDVLNQKINIVAKLTN